MCMGQAIVVLNEELKLLSMQDYPNDVSIITVICTYM